MKLIDSNIIIYAGKLGDSLIAATALAHGATLVTRNTDDFKWITGLTLVDPFVSAPSN